MKMKKGTHLAIYALHILTFVALLLMQILCCKLAYAQSTSPLRTSIEGQTKIFISSDIGDSAHLTIIVPGGRHNLYLKRVPSKVAKRTIQNGRQTFGPTTNAILFKGHVIKRGYQTQKLGAAASIIGDKLDIVFHTRRGNPIKVTKSVASLASVKGSRAAKVRYTSRYRTLPCSNLVSEHPSVLKAAIARNDASLSPATLQQAFTPSRILEISTEADFEFFQIFGSNSNAEIQSILNSAEAVYSSELGIEFEIDTQNVYTSISDPYTTNVSDQLIAQFRDYTNTNNHLGTPDVFHLFTGRNLESSVVGIAYLGVVCKNSGTSSYSLSEGNLSIPDYIVAAHEIGHTLNASHDETSVSIMNASVSSAATSFSRLSKSQITSYVTESGSCMSESPLQVAISSLSLGSVFKRRTAQFRARLTSAALGQTCTVKLFASTSKSKLEDFSDLDVSGATLLATVSIPHATSVNLAANIRNGNSRVKKKIYFKAESECPDLSSAHSAIRSGVFYTYGKNSNISPFFTKLQNALD